MGKGWPEPEKQSPGLDWTTKANQIMESMQTMTDAMRRAGEAFPTFKGSPVGVPIFDEANGFKEKRTGAKLTPIDWGAQDEVKQQ